MEWSIVIGLGCTALGAALGYLTFHRNRDKDTAKEGQSKGVMLSEIGYIKSGVDDIKSEQREQRKTNMEMVSRLTAVESSAKQAHHRLDRLEGVSDGK